MSLRFLLSHHDVDLDVADSVAAAFRHAFGDAEVVSGALPPETPAGEAAAWLRQEIARADVLIALVPRAPEGAETVAFPLGAGWALGKRLVLLTAPDANVEAGWLGWCGAAPVALTPGALVDLVSTLAAEFGTPADYGPATTTAIEKVCGVEPSTPAPHTPGASVASEPTRASHVPPSRTGATLPPPPPSVPPEPPRGILTRALPARVASFAAGRAFSECVFNRDCGGDFARELDAPFGAFLTALGGNWSTLREIGDVEMWMEVADNLLEGLAPAEDHVRAWYEIGFQLQTLLNVIGQLSDADPTERQELAQMWKDAWEELSASGREAGFDAGALTSLQSMLEILRGPEAERDYTLMGRIQTLVRERAEQADAATGAG